MNFLKKSLGRTVVRGLVIGLFAVMGALGVEAGNAYALAPARLISAPDSGSVEFLATGRPSFLKIKGKGRGPEGSIDIQDGKASGVFKFDLDSLDTGIELRTSHMKEKYLETKSFREAQLTLSSLSLPGSWSLENPSAESSPFTGTLKLHGVEKPVTGTFTSKKSEGGVELAAKFDLKLSDFNIAIPTYAGITVADQVTVDVKVPCSESGARHVTK